MEWRTFLLGSMAASAASAAPAPEGKVDLDGLIGMMKATLGRATR